MEKSLKLKTNDGHRIYGVLNTSPKKSPTLAIIVHGLGGTISEHIFYNTAKLFPKKGVDVFRFGLYSFEADARKLATSTLENHSNDLNNVIAHFRKKYKKIVLIGHSLGSPTILKSNTKEVDVIVLWDPSYLDQSRSEDIARDAKLDNQKIKLAEWHASVVLNPKMIKEWEWFNSENELELFAKLNKPLKIIAAKNGILVPGSKKFYKAAEEPKDLVIIPKAGHNFDEEGTEEVLLTETLKWIKKYGT